MSFRNPTALRVGAMGTLHGWRVRVVGRTVLGVEIDGETYYWNEYNLVDDRGTEGTLVYEETEEGPEWKLFTVFEPKQPMSAREAASKQVGDMVNLDGRPIAVTLVDESRVYHIEGTAPEGVQEGDVAHYFNADAGQRMLVASWSGDEIEFYEGRDLRAQEVEAAFGFSAAANTSSFRETSASTSPSGSKIVLVIVLGLLAVVGVYGLYSCANDQRPRGRAATVKPAAPAIRLQNGAKGVIGTELYTIEGQAAVEIGRLGRRHERREYLLTDLRHTPALLINALNGGTKEWHLFRPIDAPAALADIPPYTAAALKRGSAVRLGDVTPKVNDLFLAKRKALEGKADENTWPPVQYGFSAQDANVWVIARWTESTIQFYRGRQLPETEVSKALGPASGQTK